MKITWRDEHGRILSQPINKASSWIRNILFFNILHPSMLPLYTLVCMNVLQVLFPVWQKITSWPVGFELVQPWTVFNLLLYAETYQCFIVDNYCHVSDTGITFKTLPVILVRILVLLDNSALALSDFYSVIKSNVLKDPLLVMSVKLLLVYNQFKDHFSQWKFSDIFNKNGHLFPNIG